MHTESFYADLPIIHQFIDITDSRSFTAVPSDWYVIITDLVGSTKAIEAGRYKDVNLLGACSIVAVLNIADKREIPFVFGGDGAAILIPPSLFTKARKALLATHQRASREFGMNLRVGAVPISDLTAARYDVKIAKLRVSDNYYQAVFTGGGLSYATQLIKNPDTAKLYKFYDDYQTSAPDVKVDLSGLECRWQDIPSKHGEIVSLIVKATSKNPEINNKVYREILLKIQSIYGNDEYVHPIAKEYLKLAFSYRYLKSETKLRARSSSFWNKSFYFSQILVENILGWLFITFNLKLAGTDWGVYKETVMTATDYKKFDDMLRTIIAGNKRQRIKLAEYLEENYKTGKLVYGLHISDRALMTCLVFERNGRQVHFIDGADGGYAVAAKVMKQRITNQRVQYLYQQ
ncbi:MAG TPA: DUF3095 domain-containing protein [Chroococcales cyanobacterium]